MASSCLYMVTTWEFSAECVVVSFRSLPVNRAGTHKGELDEERTGAKEKPLENLPLNLAASNQHPSEHSVSFFCLPNFHTTFANFNLKP